MRHWLRLPDPVAVALSVLIVFGVIGGLGMLFGSQVTQQVATAAAMRCPPRGNRSRRGSASSASARRFSKASSAAPSFANVGKTIISVGSGFADLLVVIFGGIFLAAQPNFYRAGLIKLIPSGKRARGRRRADRVGTRASPVAQGPIDRDGHRRRADRDGLWLLGVPSALVLGLLAGVLEFIPFAGPILAAVPAVLIALAASPDLAIWVALLYFGVQQFEGAVLQPVVQQYAVDLPGVVLLFALIALRRDLRGDRRDPRRAAGGRHLRDGQAAVRDRDAGNADADSGRRQEVTL